ncbi:transposase family protein [Phormidium tenue FACHB-886]|nr:transposase family protein [Phormidium tenue FACHB-886]
MFYLRPYLTQAVQGLLFGMGQPQAHGWVQRLTRVLNQALGYEQQLPERDPHRLEAVLKNCPVLEFILSYFRFRMHHRHATSESPNV